MTDHELWAKTPVSLISGKTTASEYTVYCWLDVRAGRRGWFFVTQEEIATATGLSVRSVKRAVAKLCRKGLLVTDRQDQLKGQIKYQLTARERPRMAPLTDADGPPTAPRRATNGPFDAKRTSYRDPQTSPTDPDPFEKVIRRAWPA